MTSGAIEFNDREREREIEEGGSGDEGTHGYVEIDDMVFGEG
jgi:hypothetical protein